MENEPLAEPEKKSGCLKYIGCGCLIILIAILVSGYIAYRKVQDYVNEVVAEYTETAPRALPAVEVSDEEADAVLARTNAFTEALESGTDTEPLSLTARDINILIQKNPENAALADKAYITIEDDIIWGDLSIPLDNFAELFSAFKGRYLNGRAALDISLNDGRLSVFLESISVKGKEVPEEAMSAIRTKNLAEKSNRDPKVMEALRNIESISVSDGKLIIVPRR